MSDPPSEPEEPIAPPAPSPEPERPAAPPEAGTVRWYDPAKRYGLLVRADGSTLFIPPYGLAEGQGPLGSEQPVTYVVRENKRGTYAAEVRATGPAAPNLSDTIRQIAALLGETEQKPRSQIRRIVRHLGPDAARGYVAEAQRVEAAGGMMLPDGSRRRTLGGVFFTLVRDALSPEEREQVFPPVFVRKPKPATPREPAPPPPPPPPPFGWDDRLDPIAAIKPQSGKATTVKVTLIGRPAAVDERPQLTMLTFTQAGPLPPLPKGLPVPNPVPPTTYSVYIGAKQWRQVAEALHNPEDVLIVEGVQVLDQPTGTIAVFATKTTTKLIQQASRQPRPPAEG